LLVAAFTINRVGLSQLREIDFTDELSINFSSSEVRKFEKATQLITEADNIVETSKKSFSELTDAEISLRTSTAYRKIIEQLYKASDSYREGYSLAYSVFQTRRDEFRKLMSKSNHRAAGMDKAAYYEKSSESEMKRSLIRHDQVKENDRFTYTLGILDDAVELGDIAVRNAGRSVQILEDYPVEYNYGWEDDKSLEEIIRLMRDPNVNEPPVDIFATVDEENDVDTALLKEVIFKVQIAAHTEPLSEEYLSSIYQGAIKIDLIYEENWYKYSIGRYITFDEAEATRRECNISKAFVVAYQEGRKISTQDALNIAERIKEASQ
jgi:hypothetical protein